MGVCPTEKGRLTTPQTHVFWSSIKVSPHEPLQAATAPHAIGICTMKIGDNDSQ